MKINWFKIKFQIIKKIIIDVIIFTSIFQLKELLIYLKQGFKCKDCEFAYTGCNCNYCKECESKYCICNLKSLNNWTKNFILYNLSNNIYLELIDSISKPRNQYITNYIKSLKKEYENKLV